jgi:hypothetical protein
MHTRRQSSLAAAQRGQRARQQARGRAEALAEAVDLQE